MTCSVVRPCAAACGPSQMRWPSTNGASSWMSSGYTSARPPLQQRPHLGQPAPADDRARRGAQIDAALDQLRRRVLPPVGVRDLRPRRARPAAECSGRGARAGTTRSLITARSSMMRCFDSSGRRRHALEVEVDELLFLVRRQVADVDHRREPIGGRFRQRERALAELHRVHRRDREAERRQVVGVLADGDACDPAGPRETRSAT